MNRTFRPQPRGRTQQPILTLGDFTRQFLNLATESSQSFLSGAANLAQQTPTMSKPRQRKVCDCDCECYDEPQEPLCCEIDCHVYHGETVVTPIRVVNRTNQAVSYTAVASPWQGAGGDSPQPPVQVNPGQFSLNPNQSIIVKAVSQIGPEFNTGSSYRAEVFFNSERGHEKVCLTVRVSADEEAACEIQHAPPTATGHRCHVWCDHFHCDRPVRHVRG